jgi:hypothetical protein
MNGTVTEEFRESIRSIPKGHIGIFFKSIKQQEFAKIGELSTEQLTAMQERVNLIAELEYTFSEIQTQSQNES